MATKTPITVAYGDGIGPEFMVCKAPITALGRILEQSLEIVETETLRSYNGSAGYSLSQGQ